LIQIGNFEKTLAIFDNPAGDGEDSFTVEVASLTDIGVGMELIYHKSTTVPTNKAGSAVGTTIVTDVSEIGKFKQITFSKEVAFEDSETMTFRAKGSNNIANAIGVNLNFGTVSAESEPLTSTVRTTASSTTIQLNGTYGISADGTVTISGIGIKNTAANTVRENRHTGGTDRAHETEGEIIMQESQAVKAGTVIHFSGSTKNIKIAANITINSFPASNQTVKLNLDNFITPGIQVVA